MSWEGLKQRRDLGTKSGGGGEGEAVQKLASGGSWPDQEPQVAQKGPSLGGHSALPREQGGGPPGHTVTRGQDPESRVTRVAARVGVSPAAIRGTRSLVLECGHHR